jgi:hypothetical protein
MHRLPVCIRDTPYIPDAYASLFFGKSCANSEIRRSGPARSVAKCEKCSGLRWILKSRILQNCWLHSNLCWKIRPFPVRRKGHLLNLLKRPDSSRTRLLTCFRSAKWAPNWKIAWTVGFGTFWSSPRPPHQRRLNEPEESKITRS